MTNHTTSTLIARLAVATLLISGTGLTKAEPHLDLAHRIEAELIHIDVESLLDKYRELTKRTHQLELERVSMEVEVEMARSEEERTELEHHLRKVHMTQERLEHLRHETREKLRHTATELAHDPREHGEEREQQHTAEGFRERLHQFEKEIDELREAGKHDRVERLERQANEICEHLANREHSKEREHSRNELRDRFDHLQAESREARQHLEEISERLKSIDGDGEEAQELRHKLDDKDTEVREFLSRLNEQLEELEHLLREHGVKEEEDEMREREE